MNIKKDSISFEIDASKPYFPNKYSHGNSEIILTEYKI